VPNTPQVLETIGAVAVAALYGLTLIAMSLYGLNFLFLVFVAWHHRRDHVDAPPLSTYPMVTVQIPIYNERYVAERAIEAACRLDWPHDRLEIQVLDDSTDATREIVAQAVARLRPTGVNISHLPRSNRVGYKAGALRDGLTTAQGEYLAIFDADFVPPPDFLRQAMPHLIADSRVGLVQARWGHLNREASLLTRLQACNIDSHFLIEQFARDRAGWFMNFNGTAGVWRRRAIEEAGGWNIGTLTEDLDLSYRAVLSGWRTRLLPELVAPAELVGEASAYRRQQTRWAHGSVECATRLLPLVWRARLPWRMKIEAFFHLSGYAIQVLVLVMSIVYPFLLMLADDSHILNLLYWTGWVFAPIAAAPAVFFAYAQVALEGRRWWRRMPDLGLILLLGSCMVLNSTRAVLRGLRRDAAAFERTPKSGQVGRQRASSGGEYSLPIDPIVLGEVALCVFHLNTARLAWAAQSWGIFLYAVSFAAGLAYLSGLSLWQRREMLYVGLRAAISNWGVAGRKGGMRRISQRSEG